MEGIVVVTGGGTGGHLSVAKSLIYELNNKNIKVVFIGSLKGQDRQWFEKEPKIFKAYFLNTRGVVNQNFVGKFKSLFLIVKAVFKCMYLYKKFKITKVISVGGFSAAPASFAAIFSRVQFYIHEQNSVMGKLNKITSKYAKAVFSSYDKASLIKDYPIDVRFFQQARVRGKVQTIIFLGGSQGAKAINNFALKVALFLQENNISIIHQTGKKDFARVKAEYERLGVSVDLFDFNIDILKKMNQADFAVSRAGASTLWELSALGLPTLFIPYPYAAANHQYYNAKFLLDDRLCFLQEEKDLNAEYFYKIIFKENIKSLSEKLIKSIQQNGIQKIVSKILVS